MLIIADLLGSPNGTERSTCDFKTFRNQAQQKLIAAGGATRINESQTFGRNVSQ
jgi:hypothetical protein